MNEEITNELKKILPPYDEQKMMETIKDYFVQSPTGSINVCYSDIRTTLYDLKVYYACDKSFADFKIPASWYYDMLKTVKDMGLYTCEAYNQHVALRIRYIL